MTPAPADWAERERRLEGRFALVMAAHWEEVRGVPRAALRAALLEELGPGFGWDESKPHFNERFFEAACRALDRVLDRYYGSEPAEESDA